VVNTWETAVKKKAALYEARTLGQRREGPYRGTGKRKKARMESRESSSPERIWKKELDLMYDSRGEDGRLAAQKKGRGGGKCRHEFSNLTRGGKGREGAPSGIGGRVVKLGEIPWQGKRTLFVGGVMGKALSAEKKGENGGHHNDSSVSSRKTCPPVHM